MSTKVKDEKTFLGIFSLCLGRTIGIIASLVIVSLVSIPHLYRLYWYGYKTNVPMNGLDTRLGRPGTEANKCQQGRLAVVVWGSARFAAVL